MIWSPLLHGPAADRAWDAIRAVAKDLQQLPDECVPDVSLAEGHAGVSLFHASLVCAAADVDDAHTALARHHQEAAIASIARDPLDAGLHSGFTGVAFAAELLRPHARSGDDPNAVIDDALLELLDGPPWAGDYDLISGLVGFGVYALQRASSPVAARCVERVVEHLDATAERSAHGVTWWTPRELAPAVRAESGHYNLGLAHGVPGVVALLGRACAAGVAVPAARRLLDGAVAWLLAQRLPDEARGAFASWIEPGCPRKATRLAWCYGDPGVAAALFVAARGVGEDAWERAALDLARRAAARSVESSGVRDAGLCHGAAGLAHIFNRLYQATGDATLGDAARGWFERTLAMRRPGESVGGFPVFVPGDEGLPRWEAQAGLLNGAAGVALALLAAVTPFEPTWDRALLLSGGVP